MLRFLNFSFLLILLLIFSCRNSTSSESIILKKACKYLWSQQHTDGAWHSQTHGILKGGESITPFILWSLLEVPETIYKADPADVNSAIDFIRSHIKDGRLGTTDPMILDYPNYSTAYALKILLKYGVAEDTSLIDTMRGYLERQQFNESRGIDQTHLAYGAWGFGETNLNNGQHGHVDLSHTRRVLEALQLGQHLKETTKEQAIQFLSVLQKYNSLSFDGGFYASSVTLGTNKGNNFSSYATATCDGVLALLAAGLKPADMRLVKAKDWLIKNNQWSYPQGIPEDTPEQWHEVMRFYHFAVRAEAFHALGFRQDWPEEVIQILKKEQNKDGSFLNPMGAPNKEDDPYLATTFAIIALNKVFEIEN